MYDDLSVERFMAGLKKRNPNESEFHQAVGEVGAYVIPYIIDNPKYRQAGIIQRMTEPDRTITFRVVWQDDAGNVRVNRGYRVQFNNAIGPYKGGLRFHPSVTLSVLKFLAFEQTFKNSLTGLPIGAGKGGSDFNPKGKSDGDIMRFCQAFMTELYHHIGPDLDVPAGDIGVGSREISYMFGQYKRLARAFTGALTGKALEFGGSAIRSEATGYGNAYFMQEMLKRHDDSIEGKVCAVSGAGNVALHCASKLTELGAKVVTLSDSSGFIFDPDGINEEKLDFVSGLKNDKRGRISEYAEKYDCEYHEDKKPWGVACDLAFPCATQNELDTDDAKALINNGCKAISEGANMPTTVEAIHALQDAGVLVGPGKAANAGGVAISGLEMTQNAMRMSWSAEEVDGRLKDIMREIHHKCAEYGEDDDQINYVKGANIAGFIKVADAMLAYGVI